MYHLYYEDSYIVSDMKANANGMLDVHEFLALQKPMLSTEHLDRVFDEMRKLFGGEWDIMVTDDDNTIVFQASAFFYPLDKLSREELVEAQKREWPESVIVDRDKLMQALDRCRPELLLRCGTVDGKVIDYRSHAEKFKDTFERYPNAVCYILRNFDDYYVGIRYGVDGADYISYHGHLPHDAGLELYKFATGE